MKLQSGKEDHANTLGLLILHEDLFITVEGPELVASGLSHQGYTCILWIPNLLITHWNELKRGDTRRNVSFANDAIFSDIDSDRLERIRASKLVHCNSSTAKEKLLQKVSLVHVIEGETLSCTDFLKECDLARQIAKQFQDEAKGLQSAMNELYLGMGEDFERYLAIIDEQQEELAACKEQLDNCKTPSSKCNTGKKTDELSPRHARRMRALWFGVIWPYS